MSIYDDVGLFISRMDGRRHINPDEKNELIKLWLRLTGETIWCTTCSQVITDLYGKLRTWYLKEKAERAEPVEGYAITVSPTSTTYTKKPTRKNGRKPAKKST